MPSGFLDNDLYKFTMQQAVWRLYPEHEVEYSLLNRGRDFRVNDEFVAGFRKQLDQMAGLTLQPDERDYLEQVPLFEKDYLDMLGMYRYDPDQVNWDVDGNGRLSITVKRPWETAILWEVPLLAIVSELYFKHVEPAENDWLVVYRMRSLAKAQAMIRAGCKFADFGTRRRYSLRHQQEMITAMIMANRRLSGSGSFVGTSNVHFAKEFKIAAVGTVAHEWIMAHEAMFDVESANGRAMNQWISLYRGKAATALSDTYTTELFLDNFDRSLAMQYDGVRQDSGDPEKFLEDLIRHYEQLGIPASSKQIVFSDGLDADRCVGLHRLVNGRLEDSYGIGTNLTNDLPGSRPLDIVIKMTRFDHGNVVKIPDEKGKETGDNNRCRRVSDRIKQHLESGKSDGGNGIGGGKGVGPA